MAVRYISTGIIHSGQNGGKTDYGEYTRHKPTHWENTSVKVTCQKNGCG